VTKTIKPADTRASVKAAGTPLPVRTMKLHAGTFARLQSPLNRSLNVSTTKVVPPTPTTPPAPGK